MLSDRLRSTEAERTRRAIDELRDVPWARPVVNRLARAGGILPQNMPLMFEVRFAQELHGAGVVARYEFAAGEGASTVEFRLDTEPPWLIELVSVRTSDAAKRATREIRPSLYEQLLEATSDDPGRGEEGEMITAQQKIGEKVYSHGRTTKFPPPDGSVRLILTDIRGYLDEGGDHYDYYEMAYGSRGLPEQIREYHTRFWKNHNGRFEPIKGLFERDNPLAAALYIQQRVHFLGFIRERTFQEWEIRDWSLLLPNPQLLRTKEEQERTYRAYPLAHTGKTAADARRR